MHYAAEGGQGPMITLLSAKYASVNTKDKVVLRVYEVKAKGGCITLSN
jgi:hypothetical protein